MFSDSVFDSFKKFATLLVIAKMTLNQAKSLLGITIELKDLTPEILKKAYKLKAFSVHPDRNPSINAKETMQLVNAAKDILEEYLASPAMSMIEDITRPATPWGEEEVTHFEQAGFYQEQIDNLVDEILDRMKKYKGTERSRLLSVTLESPGIPNISIAKGIAFEATKKLNAMNSPWIYKVEAPIDCILIEDDYNECSFSVIAGMKRVDVTA